MFELLVIAALSAAASGGGFAIATKSSVDLARLMAARVLPDAAAELLDITSDPINDNRE